MTSLTIVSEDGKRDSDVKMEMLERIKDVIYDYADRVDLVTAIGVVEIVKTKLYADHMEGE